VPNKYPNFVPIASVLQETQQAEHRTQLEDARMTQASAKAAETTKCVCMSVCMCMYKGVR